MGQGNLSKGRAPSPGFLKGGRSLDEERPRGRPPAVGNAAAGQRLFREDNRWTLRPDLRSRRSGLQHGLCPRVLGNRGGGGSLPRRIPRDAARGEVGSVAAEAAGGTSANTGAPRRHVIETEEGFSSRIASGPGSPRHRGRSCRRHSLQVRQAASLVHERREAQDSEDGTEVGGGRDLRRTCLSRKTAISLAVGLPGIVAGAKATAIRFAQSSRRSRGIGAGRHVQEIA